jgi:hypothetical protein
MAHALPPSLADQLGAVCWERAATTTHCSSPLSLEVESLPGARARVGSEHGVRAEDVKVGRQLGEQQLLREDLEAATQSERRMREGRHAGGIPLLPPRSHRLPSLRPSLLSCRGQLPSHLDGKHVHDERAALEAHDGELFEDRVGREDRSHQDDHLRGARGEARVGRDKGREEGG